MRTIDKEKYYFLVRGYRIVCRPKGWRTLKSAMRNYKECKKFPCYEHIRILEIDVLCPSLSRFVEVEDED